jgi:hypothetical protein
VKVFTKDSQAQHPARLRRGQPGGSPPARAWSAAKGWLRERLAQLRAQRLGRPSWASYRGRGTPPGWRTAKTTLAAVLAYELARRLLGNQVPPVLAPLTALLVAQLTIFGTVKSALQQVGSVVVGVLVAVLLSKVAGLSWWSLGIVVFGSLVIGQLLRLGAHQLEVPISAMLVLAVAGQAQSAAEGRVVETLIGAAVGVAVNGLLGPPVYVQPAADAVGDLADDLAELLKVMGEELTDGWSGGQAHAWVRRTQELDGPLHAAEAALVRGEESLRFNPRRRRVLEGASSLRAGLAALEHAGVQVRGICRDLADLAERIEQRGRAEPEVLVALGRLLAELGGGVEAFGQLLAPDVNRRPGQAVPLRIALEVARTHRDVLAELMLVDAATDPELWHIQGALLANVDRLLREIDLERGPDARRVRHD